jgi:hypothetical protein
MGTGGAIHISIYGRAIVTNCAFHGNTALVIVTDDLFKFVLILFVQGTNACGGAICIHRDSNGADITNCSFSEPQNTTTSPAACHNGIAAAFFMGKSNIVFNCPAGTTGAPLHCTQPNGSATAGLCNAMQGAPFCSWLAAELPPTKQVVHCTPMTSGP